MAFFIIINIPTATNAKVMLVGLDTSFALNDDGNVKAKWNNVSATGYGSDNVKLAFATGNLERFFNFSSRLCTSTSTPTFFSMA